MSANGNVATHTDFTGEVTAYYYDAHNRLERVEYDDGSEVSYTYDMLGRRVSVTDSRGITAYQYDIRGRVTLITNPDGSQVGYTYDANGNKLSVQTSNGTTTYTYDPLNRIATVTDGSGVTVYTYDAAGKQNTVTYPNGTIADYDYDALGQLTYLENRTAGGEIISSYAYTLDDGGNRTKVVRLRQGSGGSTTTTTTTYAYDNLNRLVSEQSAEALAEGGQTSSYSRAYTYDAVGNRLTMAACVDADCEETGYAYNDNNQIISETTDGVLTQYFYDANGNTIEKDVDGTVTSFAYDDQNRLISVSNDGSLVTFTYDADGARVSKTVDGVTTEYLLDKNQRYHQVLEERTDSGALIAEYVYGNQRISMKRGGEERYYHYDGHGSTSELTDSAGLVTDEYSYEAFGNLIASTGIGINPFMYTGEAWDSETGMEYLRARYYVPGIGRFLNMDRWIGDRYSPITLNKYLYCNANPIYFTDPSGLMGGATLTLSGLNFAQLGLLALASVALPTFSMYAIRASRSVEFNFGFSEALAKLTTLPVSMEMYDAMRKSIEILRARALSEISKFGTTHQLIVMMPTQPPPVTASSFKPAIGGPTPVVFENGGNAYRILGLRMRNRLTGENTWIGRSDYHPYQKLFPASAYTVHYHVPPDMKIHHFLWPEIVSH